MVADPGEHVGEPGLRIDVVHLGGDDQLERRCCPLAAAIRAGDRSGFLPSVTPTQGALRGVVSQANLATRSLRPPADGAHRGEMSRNVLSVLRQATEPMSKRSVSAAVILG